MANSSEKLVYLSKDNFAFKSNMEVECDIINENFKRYRNILFPPKFTINVAENGNNLTELRINIEANKACPGYPGTNEDESCE